MTEKAMGVVISNKIDTMVEKLIEIKKDYAKFQAGRSNPAGVRTRKCMQEIIAAATDVRKGIMAIKAKRAAK